MKGVTFGQYHSYGTWGLLLKEAPKVSPPEPKTYEVEIPGRNGMLDLTDAMFGGVKYKNREIKFTFISLEKRENWADLASDMLEKLHGKVLDIVLDDDPGFYYTGRVVFENTAPDKFVVPFKITAMVEPYKTSVGGGVKKL